MAIISTALTIAQFVPGLAKLLMGDKAGEVADKVVTAANNIAGTDNPQQAIEYIQANPELQLKLQQETNHIIIAELEAQNTQLETINTTMRVEAQSSDKFVRRWRPFFGYTVAITWFILMLALGVVIVMHPTDAPAVIGAMASLSAMWGIALAVLGISVNKRSQDKCVAAGQTPNIGLLGAFAQRILNKGTTDG